MVTFTEEILNRKLHFWGSEPLREKCSNSDLFWSVFSLIQTEYGAILCIFIRFLR